MEQQEPLKLEEEHVEQSPCLKPEVPVIAKKVKIIDDYVTSFRVATSTDPMGPWTWVVWLQPAFTMGERWR